MTSKHGYRNTKVYGVWCKMKYRCNCPSAIGWHRYGGRGITYAVRWGKFENFLSDMGELPPGLTLDRINNDGNYEPGNCRWASPIEQCRNRCSNRVIEALGQRMTLSAWAEKSGIPIDTLHWRLKRWPLEKALTKKRNDRINLRHV